MLRSWCNRHGMLVPKLLRPLAPLNSLRSFCLCSSHCILRTRIGIEAPSPSQALLRISSRENQNSSSVSQKIK
jgi:hypothetical protein